MKQEDRAIAEYQKILAIRPDNAAVYTLIGMLEDSRKNHDAAIDNYRKALEKDQNAVIAANNLSWLYADTGKGNLDEALRLAQGVVQKNPNVAGFRRYAWLGLLQEETSTTSRSTSYKKRWPSTKPPHALPKALPVPNLSIPSRHGFERKGRQGRIATRAGSVVATRRTETLCRDRRSAKSAGVFVTICS